MGAYCERARSGPHCSLAARGLDLKAFWDEAAEALSSVVPHYRAPCWFTLDPTSLLDEPLRPRRTADDAVLVVELLGDAAPLAAFMGRPALELVPVAEPGSVSAALVTHEHPDHYDPATLAEVLAEDAVVVCPTAIVDRVSDLAC